MTPVSLAPMTAAFNPVCSGTDAFGDPASPSFGRLELSVMQPLCSFSDVLKVAVCGTVLLLLAAVASPASAEVHLCGTDDHGGGDHGFMHVCISGEITNADVERFKFVADVADHWSNVTTVSLDSEGGSVTAAMAIDDIIRKKWFWTDVEDSGQKCYSACVLILAAGAIRIAGSGSVVGIHRPYFDPIQFADLTREQAQLKYSELTDLERGYLTSMGMSDRLFAAMMAVPSGQMRTLSY
jgi:hypothetical protein